MHKILIIVPVLSLILQTIFIKNIKINKFLGVFFSLSALVISIFMFLNYETISLDFLKIWSFNTNFVFSKISLIGLFISSLITFSLFSLSNKENSLLLILIKFIEILVFGFLLSNNLMIKVIFWEAIWIPLFFILYSKKIIKFHVSWFIGQFLIIIFMIPFANEVQNGYDKLFSYIVTLFLISRLALFPFCFWLRDLVKKASFEVITLISLIFILPIFFIIQAPIIINQDIALLIFSISIIINSYYLLKDNIHFITLHLILLNALVFLLITNQTKFLIHLIIIKVFLNIIIIYIIKNKSESKTLLALATFLSFGFPGLSIPLISIIKSWPISHISIVIFVLLTSFIINLIKIIKTFEFTGFKKINYKTILILILIFLSIGISLKPEIIYNRLDYKIQENINE